jgi:hypothetical protein
MKKKSKKKKSDRVLVMNSALLGLYSIISRAGIYVFGPLSSVHAT